jgi:ribosomal protein S18 acetylase RimI-like enzyme
MNFMSTTIAIATTTDVPAMVALLNSAYRGDASRQGWTTEANLIAGDTRATSGMLESVMEQPGSVMLICKDADVLVACVNLQQQQQRLYLGMFAVAPHLQGRGVGKLLLQAAETYAKQQNCTSIYMLVITKRQELIAWYTKYGYADTCERKPFAEDAVTGEHLQPLEFMVLEKNLA